MSIDDEILIDRYLREELSSEEGARFKERLEDIVFASEVKAMEVVKNAAVISGQKSMKKELVDLERKRPLDKGVPKKSARSRVMMLVSLSILLVLSVLLVRSCKTVPLEKELYATYFEKFPNLIDPITKSGQSDEERSISSNYELGKYDEVIASGARLDASEKLTEDGAVSMFYVALSYMENEDYDRAKLIFDEISLQKSSFGDAIYYYQGLTYLALGDRIGALRTFSFLTKERNDQSLFNEEAARIIKALK